jgi:hypothetical protein
MSRHLRVIRVHRAGMRKGITRAGASKGTVRIRTRTRLDHWPELCRPSYLTKCRRKCSTKSRGSLEAVRVLAAAQQLGTRVEINMTVEIHRVGKPLLQRSLRHTP